ncbi:hypothetical protein BJX70DRAFT_364137 [Aspergillus crustosus]
MFLSRIIWEYVSLFQLLLFKMLTATDLFSTPFKLGLLYSSSLKLGMNLCRSCPQNICYLVTWPASREQLSDA